jgi:hypothetical protein
MRFSFLDNLLPSKTPSKKVGVRPLRLYANKTNGGQVEIQLLTQIDKNVWEALTKPDLLPGQAIHFPDFTARIIERQNDIARIKFPFGKRVLHHKLRRWEKYVLKSRKRMSLLKWTLFFLGNPFGLSKSLYFKR